MSDPADILVVDDEPLILDLIADGLSPSYSVSTESDPLNALKRLSSEHFDLLILDLNMPFLAGEELVQQIRADPRLSELPVLVMTADLAFKKRLDRVVVQGILNKPFTFSQLLSEVEEISKHIG